LRSERAPAGAAAEVRVGDDDIPLLHLVLEGRVEILHAVERQFGVVGGVEIPGGNDHVGVDVVPIAKYCS